MSNFTSDSRDISASRRALSARPVGEVLRIAPLAFFRGRHDEPRDDDGRSRQHQPVAVSHLAYTAADGAGFAHRSQHTP